jgi:hypothetical protein
VNSDSQLVGDVTEELLYDPRIRDTDGVAVSVDAGSVTSGGGSSSSSGGGGY